MATKVIMPQLGESVVEGTVTRWLKQVGDSVEEFESLLEVNTDKVDTEIPSPAAGTLLQILVQEDTTVNAGVTLCWIGEPGESVGEDDQPTAADHKAPEKPEAEPEADVKPSTAQTRDLGFISPVVMKIASQHGVNLNEVQGTGMNGRITKKDILAFIETQKSASSAAPWESEPESGGDLFRPTEEVYKKAHQAMEDAQGESKPAAPKPASSIKAASQVPGGDIVPLNNMRRRIAEHMVRSKHTSPHVTTVMEVDLSQVASHREKNKAAFERDGAKLTFTAYFVVAVVNALKTYPMVNSSWTDDGIQLHKHINIGMATALDDGLIVPIIRGADGLSLLGLSRMVNDLAARARLNKLQPDEVVGGTFTITNHGIFGSLFATPIINQPQCGILGVGAIQKRVVVINDAIAIRPMVYLSLTFDHRILDGASGDRFLAKVVEELKNWPSK